MNINARHNSFLLNLSIGSSEVKKHLQLSQSHSLFDTVFNHRTKKHRSRAKRLTCETIYAVYKNKDAYGLLETALLNGNSDTGPFIQKTEHPYKYDWCNYKHGSNLKIAALMKNLNNGKAFVKQYSDEDLRILIMNTFQIESYSRETLAGTAYRKYLSLFEF